MNLFFAIVKRMHKTFPLTKSAELYICSESKGQHIEYNTVKCKYATHYLASYKSHAYIFPRNYHWALECWN